MCPTNWVTSYTKTRLKGIAFDAKLTTWGVRGVEGVGLEGVLGTN